MTHDHPPTVRQLTLDLARDAPLDRAHYVVAGSNAAAAAAIMAWRGWPMARMALAGPGGSGKTHLAHIWAAEAGGTVRPGAGLTVDAVPDWGAAPLALDGADAVAGQPEGERALFHLLNHMRETGQPLLLTARAAPARWPVALPDLLSRLAALPLTEMGSPDDALLAALYAKLFADRLLKPDPEAIETLVQQGERSFPGARRLAADVAAIALAEKRELRAPLVRRVMATLAERPGFGHQ